MDFKTPKIFFKNLFLVLLCIVMQDAAFGQAKKPSIMAIPSDNWCVTNGYYLEFNDGGYITKVPDYKKAIQENSDLTRVLTEFNGLMEERGFPAKDLQQTLKSIDNQNALDAAESSKNGSELTENPIDILLQTAKSDIVIEVNWQTERIGFQSSIDFQIRALDAYSNKQIAEASGEGKSSSADVGDLVNAALINRIDDFNAGLQRHFDDMFANGREVVLRIKTWDDWDYDLMVYDFGDDELGFLIEYWVEDNTVEGRYSTTIATESTMVFEQVRIPMFENINGRERALDARGWARNLVKHLKLDLGIDAKLLMIGLGQAQITLGGR